jgi:hypothetical protein
MCKLWFIHTRGRYPDFRVEAKSGREAKVAFRKLHGLRTMPVGSRTYDESSWAKREAGYP